MTNLDCSYGKIVLVGKQIIVNDWEGDVREGQTVQLKEIVGVVVAVADGVLVMKRLVPCSLCGQPTDMIYTQRCHQCWSALGAIKGMSPDALRAIVAEAGHDCTINYN